MRKLWVRRRAVSTMVGGIIILVIFLSALVFTFAITQEYDAYQATVTAMQQKQIDMYSENILASYPGVVNGTGSLSGNAYQVTCAGGQCNNYTVLVNNLGITAKIVRIYMYQTGSTCNPCIFDSAGSPTMNRFRASDGIVNSGEYSHSLVFWLPATISLSSVCTTSVGCKVTIATARGRTFSFAWPFPFSSPGAGGTAGGTGLYLGPLVITFQKALVTYTNDHVTIPDVPIGGNNGYWVLNPGGNGGVIILYVKIQTDVNVPNDVYLTPQSVFELVKIVNGQGLSGNVNFFFAIAPLKQSFCQTFIQNGYNNDLNNCPSAYYPVSGGNDGNIGNIVPYANCGKPPATYETQCTGRYVIPKPTQKDQKGTPIIVAFAVKVPSGVTRDLQKISNSWNGASVTSFLGLSYVYDDGTGGGPYLFGVTLPFITMCISSCMF